MKQQNPHAVLALKAVENNYTPIDLILAAITQIDFLQSIHDETGVTNVTYQDLKRDLIKILKGKGMITERKQTKRRKHK